MLAEGSTAPDFELPTATGAPWRLSLHTGRPVVLFFYPKDETRVCTAEACAFRDAYEDFVDAGAEVVGISMDNEARHGRFAERHRLPYPLLADEGGRIRKLYDVPRLLGILPMAARVTYVLDGKAQVRYAFRADGEADSHVRHALRVVRELAAANPH